MLIGLLLSLGVNAGILATLGVQHFRGDREPRPQAGGPPPPPEEMQPEEMRPNLSPLADRLGVSGEARRRFIATQEQFVSRMREQRFKLMQLQAVPRRLPAGIGLAPYPEPLPIPQPPDPRLQPTWQPDAAAGAVWRTAGEAAAGAPATGWGTETSAAWQPIPTQPNGPRPQVQIADDPAARSKGQRDVPPPAVDWWGRPQS